MSKFDFDDILSMYFMVSKVPLLRGQYPLPSYNYMHKSPMLFKYIMLFEVGLLLLLFQDSKYECYLPFTTPPVRKDIGYVTYA